MNTQTRDTKGKYARRRGRKIKFFFFLVLIGLCFYGYNRFAPSLKNTTYEAAPTVHEDPNQSAIDKIKERENFKKRIENQAKQVYLQEQINDRQAKIEALKTEISGIEKDLEVTRQEELGL